ncbi:RHS repeat-associated core domain-containing protein [Pseudomonas syringae]|uniref:RHS repeat-associated core domain-containing protein n=1 Tax=Pseudomonas syringae TaxID=317 RepID=UPI000F002966|nr:RHS repeat-associated core domain-containing protein [Pseudomonas syringae]
MSSANPVVLCTYHYDATDRLADCSPAEQDSTRLFYQKSRLATQTQGQIQHTLLRTDEYLLARLSVENNQSNCALLATDQQQSVIAAQSLAFAYTPYGHRQPSTGPMNLPGFTGERVDPVTGHYLLGNGYRAFNPVLMRFNSPDSLSPFGEGGLNAYGYCAGDPVNRVDPSGHMLKSLSRFFKKTRGDQQPLLGRSPSLESMESSANYSAANPMSIQTTALDTSSAVSVPLSAPHVMDNSRVGPPRSPKTRPPLPPKHGQRGKFPPVAPPKNMPLPPLLFPRNGQAVNFPSSPPKEIVVSIEGKQMGIRDAYKQLDEWIPKT